MVKAIDFLKAHQSVEPSKWREQAQWHVENWGWLKHSTQIALQARHRMSYLGLTQKELAERMGCSQQYVSLILKGKENLTLDTISKLEKVLDVELIVHPQDITDGYALSVDSRHHYLNESSEDFDPEIKTSNIVGGYTPNKKKNK